MTDPRRRFIEQHLPGYGSPDRTKRQFLAKLQRYGADALRRHNSTSLDQRLHIEDLIEALQSAGLTLVTERPIRFREFPHHQSLPDYDRTYRINQFNVTPISNGRKLGPQQLTVRGGNTDDDRLHYAISLDGQTIVFEANGR